MTPESDQIILHGGLVSVLGCGILIVGNSGLGKSFLALDLLATGHRLVADDSVVLRRSSSVLFGCSPLLTRGLLAVRCLGLIDVRAHFGQRSLLDESAVDICIELIRDPLPEAGIFAAERPSSKYLNIDIPLFRVCVASVSRLAAVAEAAVHVHRYGDENLSRLNREHRNLLSGSASGIASSR